MSRCCAVQEGKCWSVCVAILLSRIGRSARSGTDSVSQSQRHDERDRGRDLDTAHGGTHRPACVPITTSQEARSGLAQSGTVARQL